MKLQNTKLLLPGSREDSTRLLSTIQQIRMEPATPLRDCPYIRAICDHLQAVTEGRIKKLIINVPPRTGKSTLVSVLWPCWEWINAPHRRWMFATYRMGLSLRDSVRRRDNILASEWYQSRWGDRFQMEHGQQMKHFYTNSKSGYMFRSEPAGFGSST